MLNGLNIVLGVTGGIAAYKSADLVSRLRKLNANVYVIMTKHATEFVAPLTFQTMSQNYVVTDMFESPKTWDVEHISLAKRADLFVIAPATANVIGKLTYGIADDMLTTTAMATRAPMLIAPAMNVNMYENHVVLENLEKLKSRGFHMIQPSAGRLACGDYGNGKMAEPADIVKRIVALLGRGEDASLTIEKDILELGALCGKKVLVTAGPTIEPIDPFRYVTNHSSGKMGYAIAELAVKAGAEVTLISGPTHLDVPMGVTYVPVQTALEMYNEVMAVYTQQDLVVKAAAVSDFRPSNPADQKIKKGDAQLTVAFEKNPDILKTLGENKGRVILVGFAAETHDLETYAKKKLTEKHLDLIVCNDISVKGSGFKADENQVVLYDRHGQKMAYEKMSKVAVAGIILKHALTFMD